MTFSFNIHALEEELMSQEHTSTNPFNECPSEEALPLTDNTFIQEG